MEIKNKPYGKGIIPIFAEIGFSYPSEIKPLTVSNFVKKLFDSPTSARLILAFPKRNGLWFPDEAVSNIRRNVNRIDLDLVSGYYEENCVFTPQNIDLNRLREITSNESKIRVDTKQYGILTIFDMLTFTYEEGGNFYDFIAVIADVPVPDEEGNGNNIDEIDKEIEDVEFEFEEQISDDEEIEINFDDLGIND